MRRYGGDPTEALPDTARRLLAAAHAVGASRANYEDNLELRDRLVVEACDAGYRWQDVAKWAGLSNARVNQIIAKRGAAAAG